MAPLIAPGICRFTINGTYGGVNVANILDVHIDDAFAGPSRDDDILDQAKIIVSAWCDNILPLLSDAYECQTVSWLDLNADDGSTGSTALGTGSDFPQAGDVSASCFPGNVSVVVRKNIVSARGARKGRMYLVGIPESFTDAAFPNTFNSSDIDPITAALADFMDDVNQSGGDYDSEIVVVHTKNTGTVLDPVIEFNGTSVVETMVCDVKAHSQRRRLGL